MAPIGGAIMARSRFLGPSVQHITEQGDAQHDAEQRVDGHERDPRCGDRPGAQGGRFGCRLDPDPRQHRGDGVGEGGEGWEGCEEEGHGP
jgi:hypothetical protein